MRRLECYDDVTCIYDDVTQELLAGDEGFGVPRLAPELCAQRILATELMPGLGCRV
jgi:predicted unusual protein kinase regulating ubiquinone biosynthesis (AarF/ABC1/UbiB family)